MCDAEHPQVTGSIPAGCPGDVFFVFDELMKSFLSWRSSAFVSNVKVTDDSDRFVIALYDRAEVSLALIEPNRLP